jgi:hypothetical protein
VDRFLNILRAVGLVLAVANVAVQLRNNLRMGVVPEPLQNPAASSSSDAFDVAFERAQRAARGEQ